MLQQAKRLADANHLHNLAPVQGNATDLPWIDAQFDLVVCRLTLHQVGDPAAVVREMVRVTKDGGRIAVIDMIADPPPESPRNPIVWKDCVTPATVAHSPHPRSPT
jgi:ubiquinone/menaquinone biosynthesis C-methylase UbiE